MAKKISPEEAYREAVIRIQNATENGAITLDLGGIGLTIIPNDIIKCTGHLKELNLNVNSIVDTSVLSKLKHLTALSLSNNQISDISALSKLKNLTELYLYDNPISDITPLSKLKNLTELSLSNNQISDITPLSNLHNLTALLLYNNEISDITALSKLQNLTRLDLDGNQISDITPLSNLHNLTKLYLNNNRISDITPLSNLHNLGALYLHKNQISDISKLSALQNLMVLYLMENQISDITPLSSLKNLTELYLSSNQISDITPLSKLKNLTELYLYDNQISDVTALSSLQEITNLDLFNNQISDVPRSFFERENLEYNFDNNPLLSPPLEVLLAGRDAVLDYFAKLDAEGTDKLYEAKLIVVGEPGAGKTTFCRKLEDTNTALPEEKESTKGIDIAAYKFTDGGGKQMQLNVWDFGGQEIYHQTHQFFLTHKSLYILLSDNRRQDTDFNWWLETIQAFGGGSPIVIVQNERGDRVVDLPIKEITERYKQVKQAQAVNFATNRGVDDLRNIVKELACRLEHIGEDLPKSWVKIRKELVELANEKDCITIDHYKQLCAKYGISNEAEAMRLCTVYHNLGVLLHFGDNAALKHLVILRNEWATDAVYKMIDDRKVTDSKGRFDFSDCLRVWNEPRHSGKQHELLAMMLKFDLCYRLQDKEEYLLPQLLPADQPKYEWDETNNLQVTYRYEEYMPKGLVNRLMARLNWYADIERSWKTGAVFTKLGATAEVREPFGKKEITVRISGTNQRDLLLFIDEELERIHRTFARIVVKKLLGCICSQCMSCADKQQYDYDKLINRYNAGKQKIECGKSYEDVDVLAMISNTFPMGVATMFDLSGKSEHSFLLFRDKLADSKKKRMFISYSKADIYYRERLTKYIQQLERNDFVSYWSDKDLVAGEEWDERIKTELEQADIILFLCSQDMLSTDYIQRVELKRAFERAKKGEAIAVPIIVKPCTWTDDKQLPTVTALPTKAVPVIDKSWGDIDYAYMDIYEGLKKLIGDMDKKQSRDWMVR
ncbi:MAG: hypothetical protein RLZZ367_2470 [Bacteroidota bacterium]|jgi:Leucine-rich repeat (LRR) protein/GTPase SAR1 family protein